MQKTKQLYHIDTDTLITLLPKGMILEVKQKYNLAYRMEKVPFSMLFLLAISHPYVVTYKEITEVLSSVGIELKGEKQIRKCIKELKAELRGYKIKKLIVSVKGIGYAISNEWVEPMSLKASFNNNIQTYIKKLCGIVASSKDEA